MSLSSQLFRNWWASPLRMSRMIDQHFANDILSTLKLAAASQSALLDEISANQSRNWRQALQETGSSVNLAKNKFQINLDVQQFAPEEISVKATEDSVIIEGKHEEKQDEHGFITRHFVRRYMLPAGHDRNGIVSQLSPDGVLTITAPLKELPKEENVKQIPIMQTDEPVKKIEGSEEAAKEQQKKEESK